MNYSDFSSIFPSNIKNNYQCIYNPNPGFANDCIGSNILNLGLSTQSNYPNMIKSFTMYPWALPITIPSTLTADDTTKGGKSPDTDVSRYWIQAPHVPTPTFSDLYPDPNPTNKGKPFVWDGLNKAMSKCIELDGSTYPPSNNICKGNSTDSKNCVNPLLAYPNKKPSCYAVVTQSDYTGNELSDTMLYSLNYFLVEEPNSSPISDLANFNVSLPRVGPNWVTKNKIDQNYLFCQSQFYTWIKNKNSGEPYNTAPTTNFTINSCPGPVYTSMIPVKQPDTNAILALPPSFYADPNDDWLKNLPKSQSVYKNPPSSSPNTTTYILIGVVVVILLGVGYYLLAGSKKSVIIPLKVAKTIGKKIGGYYYYDDI
jgi:hypothetical protein